MTTFRRRGVCLLLEIVYLSANLPSIGRATSFGLDTLLKQHPEQFVLAEPIGYLIVPSPGR
jgi:hypothetical protein